MIAIWSVIAFVVGSVSGLGQVVMRYGGRGAAFEKLFSLTGLVNYRVWWLGIWICWVCGLLWAFVVTRVPVTICMPISIAAAYFASAIGGVVLLNEPFKIKYIYGFVLILIGMYIITRES